MNVFTKLPSVQGYGSLISSLYDTSTGTHPQAAIDACQLADGTFTQLRLSAIAVSYAQLGHSTKVVVTPMPNCRLAAPSVTVDRYFGQSLHVSSVTVRARAGGPIADGPVDFTLLDGRGNPVGPVLHEVGANQNTFAFSGGAHPAAGFELYSTTAISIGDALVTQEAPIKVTYKLDSPMQEALDSSQWHLTDTVGTFSVFKAENVRPSVWLETFNGGTAGHVKNAPNGDTWVSVHAYQPVTLVRSMAYLPGWRATALNTTTGKSEALKVSRNGLVQQVTVPSGRWRVHFHYHAPYIETGLTASVVGVALLIGAGLYLLVDDRRRRTDKVRS
jgi:hypothetical protein